MTFARVYQSPRLALPLRVALYAYDNHGRPLARGELREAIDPHSLPTEISRAIRAAKRDRLIRPDSTASQLYSLLVDQDGNAGHLDTVTGNGGRLVRILGANA